MGRVCADDPPAGRSTGGAPWPFVALVFALAAPLWAIGALTGKGMLGGLGTGLPLSALMFVCPLAAAMILVRRRAGAAGVRGLLRRVFDLRSLGFGIWYLPVVLLLPLLYSLSYVIQRLTGSPLPGPRTSVPTILVLSVVFLVSAAGEEGGWTGYALDPLRARLGALGAGLTLGLVWGAIHVVPDLQAHRSWAWIAGQRSFSIALRVLIVWVYGNTGYSVLAAIVFHATDNVGVYTLFPDNGGSHYNPAVTAALAAVAALVVTLLWGPRTLNRFRYARRTADRGRGADPGRCDGPG